MCILEESVQYLGHLLSGAGIELVPEKLQALREIAEPDCAKGVKIYLGFVVYYRKFIPKYSDIAKPLTELTKLDVPFVWTAQCQKSFYMLREYLLKEPILVYPDTKKPYTLYRCQQICMGRGTHTKICCTVSLSVFAGPEQILRRFYVFAEEPCKSTITTSEPCSPVFKEAQPKPSNRKPTSVNQSISLIS